MSPIKPLLIIAFFFVSLFAAGLVWARNGDGWNSWRQCKVIADNVQDVEPLWVGDTAPYGTLRTAEDKPVDLETFLHQKPTILVFYQGSWSPDSNLQLAQWVKLAPRLEALGYQVAAITPDKPAKLKKTMTRYPIHFTLLSDRTKDVIRRFGLAYRPDETKLQKWGISLADTTGDTLYALPLPAVYGLDQKGVIRFLYLYPYDAFGDNPENLLKTAKDALSGIPESVGDLP